MGIPKRINDQNLRIDQKAVYAVLAYTAICCVILQILRDTDRVYMQ